MNRPVKSFKLWYNPKFNSTNPFTILESRYEGDKEEGRQFLYSEKAGEIQGELKIWGHKKGYYTTDGHKFNQTFHYLPRDKWTTFSEVQKCKWGKDANITDIEYE